MITKYLAIIFLLLCINTVALSDEKSIIVFYPEVNIKYQSVIDDMVDGITYNINFPVKKYLITPNIDKSALRELIYKNNNQLIITIGETVSKAIAELNPEKPIIFAGILNPFQNLPENSTIISFAPSPNLLFKQLKLLKPNISSLHVVYNSQFDHWLIDIASKDARLNNIRLITYPVNSFKESAKIHKTILNSVNNKTDAIWIIQNQSVVDDRVILNEILKYAWQNDVTVMSSDLRHVNKGILFSMYPNNFLFGKQIAETANKILNHEEVAQIIPTNALDSAFNYKTAKHLNIRVKPIK